VKSSRKAFLVGVALLAGLVLSGPLLVPEGASAHATLLSTEPERGARLDSPPERVVFRFSETVETGLGSVEVFDSAGEPLETGPIENPSGDGSAVSVEMPDGLGYGVYTAVYRVVSADSHPISGGFTFIVGEGGYSSSPAVTDLLDSRQAGPVTDAAFWLVRWLGWIGAAAAVGALLFLLALWLPLAPRYGLSGRPGETARRWIGLLLAGSIGLVLCSAVASVPLQGATGAGVTFWDALNRSTAEAVLETSFGTAVLLRLIGALAVIPLVVVLLRPMRDADAGSDARPVRILTLLGLFGVLLFAAGAAMSGHAATQGAGWLVRPAAALHFSAMALWTGGLLALAVVLPKATGALAEPDRKTGLLTDSLLRFSTVALACVVVLVVTGLVQTLATVESPSDLVSTSWGRALLVKLLLFSMLVALGARMRRRIIPALVGRRSAAEPPGKPGRKARTALRGEVLLAAAVLAVTALLVTYPPPGSVASGPVSGSIDIGGDRLEYTIEPAAVGSNEMHVYLFDGKTGQPEDPLAAQVEFSQPDAGIPAFEGEVRRAGPGHFLLPSVTFGVPGDWEARIALRISRFTERSASFGFEVE
jgi:copper transport protein